MADNEGEPLGKIAPDWVDFTDVPMWIERRFGVKPPPRSMQDLLSLIRQDTSDDPFALPSLRTVRHRVQD